MKMSGPESETPEVVDFDDEWEQAETDDYKRPEHLKFLLREVTDFVGQYKQNPPECPGDQYNGYPCANETYVECLKDRIRWLEQLLLNAERFIRDHRRGFYYT